MDRRTFLTGAAVAGATAVSPFAEGAEKSSAGGGFPVLRGPEFAGMDGVFTALFTPFRPDGSLNEAMIGGEIEYGLANGVRGFYLTGGTGEGLKLTFDERVRVYRSAVKAAKGRAKLIAQVGCVSSDESARLAKAAAEVGCDWVSSVPPVYYGKKFEDALHHYEIIAAATDLPFLVYSVGGNEIQPDRDRRIFDIPNVKGMKYTGTDFYAVQRLKRRLDKEVVFLSGSDQHFIAALAFGNVFSGCIGTVQNIVPKHFVRIYEAMRGGDWRTASAVQDETNRIVEFVCHSHANMSFRKGMMRYIGLDCGSFRAPDQPLSEADYAELVRAADAFGLVRRNAACAFCSKEA